MGKKILIVEDSHVFQQLLKRLLREHETTVVGDTKAAQALIKETAFDLLIADFVLGDGDCSQFLMELRQRFSPTELPIVMLSSSMDVDMMSQYNRIAINACISKPLDLEKFPGFIRQIIETKEVIAPAKPTKTTTVLSWRTVKEFHVYCPAVNHKETAATPAEAMDNMRSYLRAHADEVKTTSTLTQSVCRFD